MAEIYRREGGIGRPKLSWWVGGTERFKESGIASRIKRDLAGIHFRRGDWDKAIRTYGDIAQTGRLAMTALDYQRYAWALHISGQCGQAHSHYRQAPR